MKKLLAMMLALVMVLSMLTVAVFAEPTDQDEEPEDVVDTPVVDVEPEPEDTTPPAADDDANPGTGIVLAGLPVVIAAAAAVVSKKH